MLDEHLVLSPPPKKPCRCIEDITIWTEAVTVLTLILTSSSPHCWKDLKLYKLLVLRIYRQFSRQVWLAYDKAFHKHAAATRLADWSAMNAQLFNFHTTGASLHSYNLGSSTDSSEPAGSSSSRLPCTSWNKGRCTAPHTLCHYYHHCSTHGGTHHSVSCALRPDHKLESTFSHSSRSPAASSLSSQKAVPVTVGSRDINFTQNFKSSFSCIFAERSFFLLSVSVGPGCPLPFWDHFFIK